MFKKPLANLKSFSPLRSSDRRRFQNEAYEAYPSVKEICSQEGASHLMLDSLRSAKFTSHTGVPGVVYMSENKPLWITIEQLPPIPTVHTMWQYPNMLPKLYTWGPVVAKLMEGADLMIPGLVAGPDGTLPNVDKGGLVAITIKGYPFPLAVGTMALPTTEIKPRSGMKGKAVHIIHVFKDFLWEMGDKSEPPEALDVSDDEYEEDPADNENENGNGEEKQEPVSAPDVAVEKSKEQVKSLSPAEVDEILKKSLYQALLFKIKPDTSNGVFPISASSFYSAHILPCRPKNSGPEVDIKKSSWKKLQKFLKTMEKAGLLKTKDQRGETMVTSINWSHPSLQNVTPYKTMETPSSSAAASASQASKKETRQKTTSSAPTGPEQAEIKEYYKPLGNGILKLFEEAKHPKDAMYSIPEIRQVLSDYIKASDLADPKNQKLVKIDPILCDAILTKQEYNSINALARDQILHRLCTKMQPFHSIKLPGKEEVLRKGQPKPVEITQEIRQGRKTVTKITGVEGFGLEIEELTKELTKLCASSTTFNSIQGVSPKNPLYEIMVQGPQIRIVNELLLSKGVPKRYIDTFDKTAKKGKGKK